MHHTDRSNLPFGHSSAILDPYALRLLDSIDFNLYESLYDLDIKDNFCSEYLKWISLGKLNTIVGLEQFQNLCYSNGTSESFDKFYIKNRNRRFRCFKGEYMYHQLSWRNSWPDWKFIEDATLTTNDAIVISLPFADTGTVHPQMESILDQCSRLNIPVLLDCAYYGICSNIEFNFNFDCITDIVFSLSKVFPVAHARIGMRLTRTNDDDSLFVYDKNLYTNRLGATIGLEFIKNFSPDYIVKKYKETQIKFCKQLDIVVSDTVLFGLDYSNKFPQYQRGTGINRLGLHKFLHLGELNV